MVNRVGMWDQVTESSKTTLAAFAFLRIFLGAVWLFELFTDAPWAEIAGVIGALLVVGLLTPVSGLVGAVLSVVAYTRAGSGEAWGAWPWLYWLLILMHVLVALTRSGRVWGVDVLLARWRSNWPIW